jgi:lysozyme
MNKQENIADLKSRNFSWPIPWAAVELIAEFEDCKLVAYLCPAGKPTIGWGETNGIRLGMTWTKEQADRQFFTEICDIVENVKAQCKTYTTPEQLGAMVSFTYNVGLDGLKKSTVLKAHNESNFEASARAFSLWNKARINGKLEALPGLTARRLAESALYMRNDSAPFPEPFAQDIAPETSLAKSHINVSGAASVLAGTATVASSAIESVKPVFAGVKDIANSLSINPITLLGIVAIVVGISVMYWRNKQRIEGWA